MALIQGLAAEEIARILSVAEPILAYITAYEDNQHGGVLCVANRDNGVSLASFVFGCLRNDEYEECRIFAEEKPVRLARNILHYLSSESRDMTTTPKQYGGAIRGRNFILSFSGFKEVQDEAAMLLVELRLGGGEANMPTWLRDAIAGNSYFAKLQMGTEPATD